MEVFIRSIPLQANDLEIHDYFRDILHGPRLRRLWNMGWLMSFDLFVHSRRKQPRRRRQEAITTGVLRLPHVQIAQELIALAQSGALPPLYGRRLLLSKSRNDIERNDVEALRNTPYIDPERLRERNQLQKRLATQISLSSLSFGRYDRDQVYSPEWNRDYTAEHDAILSFDATTRRLVIAEQRGVVGLYQPRRVLVRFGAVESLKFTRFVNQGFGLLLTLHEHPMFEEEPDSASEEFRINLPGFGEFLISDLDLFQKPEVRKRRSGLHDTLRPHEAVVPYISSTLFISFNSKGELETALRQCRHANLPKPEYLFRDPSPRRHFSVDAIRKAHRFIQTLPYPVAFQLLTLLMNTTISAKEINMLSDHISAFVSANIRRVQHAAEIIWQFGEALKGLNWRDPSSRAQERVEQDLIGCFEEASKISGQSSRFRRPRDDIVMCYHLNITPTSMAPEGPMPEQSNRVLRRYAKHEDRFLRVNLSDENKLDFRFDRDVDGEGFVRERFGAILKRGVEIAGREFQFLAYSNSALKEHAVWFVSPFKTADGEVVNAEVIRSKLGDFSKVIRCPARYGARLSQAFTSTDVSITITAEELILIPDITSSSGVVFTDGVGVCSRQTMDDIAAALEESARGKKRSKKQLETSFSAVQIRLAGNKGMLSVDYTHNEDSILVRDSMNKFTLTDLSLDVEVADVFTYPKPMYLNRPLIMILETLGVSIPVFDELQKAVIKEVKQSVRSLTTSARLLTNYGLGSSFRIPSVLLSLSKYGVEAPPDDDDFLHRALNYAVNDVLRSLKHKARIRVPDSWTLVGIADIHQWLQEGEVFVCVRDRDGKKRYLDGRVLVTRSPAIHPGDVQMARAIGRPPKGSPFEHEDFPNCVVFACQGSRSLPQSLGGGDLDGDLYNVIQYKALFPQLTVEPAAYPPTQLRQLPEGRQSTIDDVADFVVDFINNDRLGVIAKVNLEIADSSPEMSRDERCIRLAELHSIAVDFQKSGVSADLKTMPKGLSQKPDWSLGEIVSAAQDVYPSTRALGVLFRNVELPDTKAPRESRPGGSEDVDEEEEELALDMKLFSIRDGAFLNDAISLSIMAEVESYVSLELPKDLWRAITLPHFLEFTRDLTWICNSCTSTRRSLTEEECWAGTIVAKSSQPKRRNDYQARMREQCRVLCDHVRQDLNDTDGLEEALKRAWAAWVVSRAMEPRFGAKTYGWIALGAIFDVLKDLEEQEIRL